MAIIIEEMIELNGQPQFVSIRGKQPDLPLLLYLHGGPGDAAFPLMRKYNQQLEKHFIVVNWEQRGAGKSYYPFGDQLPDMATFEADLLALVKILLTTFKREKLYLAGHSWGSVLGLRFIQQHPELIEKYFGIGQVVNMQENFQRQCQFVLTESQARQDKKTTTQLLQVNQALNDENWLKDLLFVTKKVVKYRRSLYGKSNYNQLVKDFIFSREYSLKDLLNREKGSLQAIQTLWPELMTVDFSEITHFEVPVVFFMGRHDQHVSADLLARYYQRISSAKEIEWFEVSSHFPQWEEAEKFNQLLPRYI